MQLHMPSNVEAEQQILGALLVRDEIFYDVTGELTPDDFYDRGHAAIYRTIEQLVQGGKRVNVTLVRDYVLAADSGTKNDHHYLEHLMDAVADLGDTIHYARQVADLARRRRILTALIDGATKISKLDPLVPSSSIVDEVETEILSASHVEGVTMRRLGEWAQVSVNRVIEAVENPKAHAQGLKWGLTAVDNIIGPLLPGKLVILGGRPGMGKSALAGQAAESFGAQAPGYIQSLEMEGDEWAERSMAHLTEIGAWRIHRAKVNEADIEALLEAARRLRELPVYVDHKTRLNASQIRARAIRYKHQYGIKWMVVDHLHIIQGSNRRMQPAEIVNENAYELKQIAKDLGLGVLALAQLNKEVRGRAGGRPRAGDLLYYSSIEPHADSIIFPHRPEVVLAEEKPEPRGVADAAYDEWQRKFLAAEGKAEMINAKSRAGKPYQTQECRFLGSLMKFADLQEDQPKLADEEMSAW